MGSFYKDMLNKNSLAHDAAVAATLKSKCRGPEKAREGSDSEEGAEETVKTRSDAELAREAVSKGLNVELNDDNLIVDKRELLSAGLNVVSKKVRGRPSTGASGSGSVGDDSRGGGTGDGGRSAQSAREAQRARQSRLMEEQMVELERKRAAEAEEAAKEARKKLARRNDEDGVSSARERYLARKSEREREREREAAKEE